MGTTTDIVPSANDALQNLFSQLSAFGHDFLAFIVLAAVLVLFMVYFGRDRIAPLVAALYASLVLYEAFPFMGVLSGPYLKIGLYLLFAFLFYIAFSGLSYFMAVRSGGFVTEIAMAVLVAGFVLAISTHVLPVQDIYQFTAATTALFASTQAYFWWLVAPLAGLFFLGR